jgi:hypothetical protein
MLARRKVLAFSAGVEAATGLGLLMAPAFVVRLLLGDELTGLGLVVARCFGVALLALSLTVWPRKEVTPQAVQGMFLYNAGLAIYLAWLGTGGHLGGPMHWPAAVVHGIVAALLARPAGKPA